ncbi:sulfur carrier protein ThiS [Vibrio rumoiensis]|uniref:Thiamine biosynthesis protein ThiS n=1 Tax=Vibrio rumoiensis 1S-45 TaxID=1188252 RepID=A0A1E5E3U5_9VIBR|nr:sulfur carrier protein ThiS [Vibrio rumoiensis]OEF27187.1 thiamine biosynthesis protein ThiS [Vibrio rumoiensis 1S-45]
MQVTVNDKIVTLEQVLVLEKLFQHLSIDAAGAAIAINDVVVPKTIWSTTLLKNGDDISIFKMIAGG